MDVLIALTLFAFAATLVAYTRATCATPPSTTAYLVGDVPRKTPAPGTRDRYAVTGALAQAPVPSWG